MVVMMVVVMMVVVQGVGKQERVRTAVAALVSRRGTRSGDIDTMEGLDLTMKIQGKKRLLVKQTRTIPHLRFQ